MLINKYRSINVTTFIVATELIPINLLYYSVCSILADKS